jgi:hypothetical protein
MALLYTRFCVNFKAKQISVECPSDAEDPAERSESRTKFACFLSEVIQLYG